MHSFEARQKKTIAMCMVALASLAPLFIALFFFSFLAYQGISLEYFSNTGLVQTFHQLYTFILLLDFIKVSLAWSGKFWQPLGTP